MSENGLAVRLIDIHRFFQRGSERLDVLHGLTLEVPHGEFLALMGPSGSGKTTLLNLIAGLDKPSRGEVWVGSDRISDYTESKLTPLADAEHRLHFSVLPSASRADGL